MNSQRVSVPEAIPARSMSANPRTWGFSGAFLALARRVLPSGMSRMTLEFIVTVLAASMFAMMFNASPLLMIATSLGGILIALCLAWTKLEYLLFFLVVFLPFRDIHIISILHLKRLIIWGLLGYYFFRSIVGSPLSFSPSLKQFTKWVLLFLAMLFLSLFQTAAELYTSPYLTRETFTSTLFSNVFFVIEEVAFVYIVYCTMTTFQQLRRLLWLMLAVSVMIAGLGLAQYYWGGPPPLVSGLFDPGYHFYGRATSVFSNPNMFGAFLGPLVGIAGVAFVWAQMPKRVKFGLLLPVIALNCWGIFLSSSRAAMLQVLFSFVAASILYHARMLRGKFSWKVLGVIVAVGFAIFMAVNSYELLLRARLGNQIDQTYQMKLRLIETKNDFSRQRAIVTAFESIIKHPLIGIGYSLYSGKSVAGFEHFGLGVHNQYLSILVELGLLGCIPFLAALVCVIRTGWRFWGKYPDQERHRERQLVMLLLLTGFCTAIFGYAFADSIAVIPVTGYLFIWAGGIFVCERLAMQTHDLRPGRQPN